MFLFVLLARFKGACEFHVFNSTGGANLRQTGACLIRVSETLHQSIHKFTPDLFLCKAIGLLLELPFLLVENATSGVIGRIVVRKRLAFKMCHYKWKIHAVYVVPELRGTGLGTQLVEHALEFVRSHNVPEVTLKVDKDNNAINLYKRCGFTIESSLGNSLVLVCRLGLSA